MTVPDSFGHADTVTLTAYKGQFVQTFTTMEAGDNVFVSDISKQPGMYIIHVVGSEAIPEQKLLPLDHLNYSI